MPKRLFAAVLFLALFPLLAVGCTVSRSTTETGSAEGTTAGEISDTAKIRESGVLRIGVLPNPPVFYRGEDSDEWIGFGGEMSRRYAGSLNVKPEYRAIDPENAEELLETGEIDCVWGRTAWTEAQKESMSFSGACLKNQLAVVVHFRNKDKAECKDPARINKMKEFVVVEGSPGEAKAKEIGANYSTEKDLIHCLLRVAAGTATCALVDLMDCTSMIGEGTQYENLVYTVTFDLEEYSVGFRKDSDLIPSLNSFFAASFADGSMAETAGRYRIANLIMEVK